jgi:hypothetical protein
MDRHNRRGTGRARQLRPASWRAVVADHRLAADILAVVDPGNLPDGVNLDQLRDLLAGLGGMIPDGNLLGWASQGDLAAVSDEVFGVVRDAGLLADGNPRQRVTVRADAAARMSLMGEDDPRQRVNVPTDATALMSLLWEVDEPAVIELLTSLAGSTGPNRLRRRMRQRHPDEPRDIFAEMARLTGPDTRWWTNTDLTRWNPITQHTFDAIVVGAGNGIILTLIAFEGGG